LRTFLQAWIVPSWPGDAAPSDTATPSARTPVIASAIFRLVTHLLLEWVAAQR
jgi:hypothetical protein